ncbi:non-ribosomal peptide synthetase [Pseudogulbenkiania ferrooxidans]|uniref:non-ribosomal peptide synthetase n=1 Tax=Pseudogulbenkiania ferrooxidans TaxID=549169 RepID=UPI0004095618|nr:non-ribosomal peptide synthetase [Pseudogulbenkiania ferrooxidans]
MHFHTNYSEHLTSSQQSILLSTEIEGSPLLYTTIQKAYLKGDVSVKILIEAINATLTEYKNSVFSDRPLLNGNAKVKLNNSGTIKVVSLLNDKNQHSTIKSFLQEKLNGYECAYDNFYHDHILFKLSKSEVLWVSIIHHIFLDAFSYYLLRKRVGEYYNYLAYNSLIKGSWFCHVKQAIAEEKLYLSSNQFKDDKIFWDQKGAQIPAPTFLSPAPWRLTNKIIQKEINIQDSILPSANNFSKEFMMPLIDVMIGIIISYFAKLTNTNDLVFGIPMMGRMGAGKVLSMTTHVNILPLHIKISTDESFFTLIQKISSERKKLSKHQNYRSEWIARDQARVDGSSPIYGIEINVLPYFPGAKFEKIELDVMHELSGPVRDINVHMECNEFQQIETIKLIGNSDQYCTADLKLHLKRIRRWAQKIIQAPNASILDFELTSMLDLKLMKLWNNTSHVLTDMSIIQLFKKQVQVNPNHIAVQDSSRNLTYQELDSLSASFAIFLKRAIPYEGTGVIGVMLDRSVELEIVLLAIIRSGAAFMPIVAGTPKSRIDSMCRLANVKYTVCANYNESNFPSSVKKIKIDDFKFENNYQSREGDIDNKLCGRGPAYILFTSGSTGEPKGVQVSHGALINRLLWMQSEYKLISTDKVLQKTPMSFDVSIWEFFWPIISGSTLYMAKPDGHLDPIYIKSTIESQNITTIHFVPSMLWVFIDSLSTYKYESTLKNIFVSGEALSIDLVNKFSSVINTPLHNLYGPTEAAIDVTYHQVGTPRLCKNIPIGRPIWNTKMHVLDEHLKVLPIGIPGNLYIEGVGLADGYIGRKDLTESSFIYYNDNKRIYKTGDIAKWCIDGQLEYLGRNDQQVKINGSRVELNEIELTLLQHESIKKAFVQIHDNTIVAYVECSNKIIDEKDLVASCQDRLPSYMVPGKIFIMEALPIGKNGKLDRKSLPKPFESLECENSTPVDSFIEQQICEYFNDVLKIEHAGPLTNFFHSGGNSLKAIELAVKISNGTKLNLTIASIFSYPTPRSLARSYKDGQPNMLDHALVIKPKTSENIDFPTLFCIHPAGGLSWCYSGFSRYLKYPGEIIGIQAVGLNTGETAFIDMDEVSSKYAETIIKCQSNGPYVLIGWSVGGMIAHSIAVTLEARGKEVKMLAMMDSYPSNLWEEYIPYKDSNNEETLALAALLFIAGIPFPSRAELPSILISDEVSISRGDVIKLLRENRSALGSLDNEIIDRIINIVINSRKLVWNSKHKMFSGDLVFFTAARPRQESWLHFNSWDKFIDGRIINYNIDCDHPGMAKPEALKSISAIIDNILHSEQKHRK